MKTKEEIEQLAEEQGHTMESRFGFVWGYKQCQEDIADKKYTEEDMISFAYQFSNINVSDFRKHLKDFDVNLKEKNKQ